ncbi:hypothetical protein HA466_0163100 [Hirschfeldia incana]|nr:hypothetical protein HA466_0163100 [Hirschfeldia incana]
MCQQWRFERFVFIFRCFSDHQDQCDRYNEHARSCQACWSKNPAHLLLGGLWRSSHPLQPESYWGNVNPIGVQSCYDEGKRVAETLMFDYHRQHGIEIRIARIFNMYGPRMNIDDGRVVSNFISQALRGEALTVQTHSFCYVSDMVDGLIRLMEGDDTGPINIGNPRSPLKKAYGGTG